MKDARILQISADRRFATAYNAALQLATIAIACEGYRVSGLGHHYTTFRAVELALGDEASSFASYFEKCRKKRNQVDYDIVDVVTDADADDLLGNVMEFERFVDRWIAKRHPEFPSK